jgi:hypothetical protein
MFPIVFYAHWGNIRLTSCFCGIARIDGCYYDGIDRSHVFYCVLLALGQYQISELLLRDRPNSCSPWGFTRIGVIPE